MTSKCTCCHKVNPDPHGKREAMAEAKTALQKMRTVGWKIKIWHNINWYWRLRNRYITIHPGFWASMSDDLKGSGSPMFWSPQDHRTFKDPNAAAQHVLNHAQRFVDQVSKIVGDQREALRRGK